MILNPLRSLRQTITLFVAIVSCFCLSESIAQQSLKTVAQLRREIDEKLEMVGKRSPPEAEVAVSLLNQIDEFRQQSIMIFGQRKQELEEKLQQFQRSVDEWRAT